MGIEINGKEYECSSYDGRYLDLYLYKDVLYDELPKGTVVRRYTTTEDGSVVGICASKVWKTAIAVIICMVALSLITAAVAQFLAVMSERKSGKSDVEVIDDSTESAVVSVIKDTDYILKYNRYTLLKDGYIDIMYQNIDKDVTLSISNVDCEEVTVKANEYLPSLKVDVPEDTEMPLRATMIVKIGGDKYTVPIVINDEDSLDYQMEKKEHSSDNRVNLTESEPDVTEEQEVGAYENPSSYVDVERTIHD